MQTIGDKRSVSPCSFQVYCHADSSCALKVVGQERVQDFDDILTAIDAAREMSGTGESPLTVYDPLGVVVFETHV